MYFWRIVARMVVSTYYQFARRLGLPQECLLPPGTTFCYPLLQSKSISAQCTFICYHLLNDFIAGWLHSFRPRCIRKVKKKCLAIHDSSGENILAVFGCMKGKNIMASVFYESLLQSLIPASVNARRKKIKCPHAVSSNVCSPN